MLLHFFHISQKKCPILVIDYSIIKEPTCNGAVPEKQSSEITEPKSVHPMEGLKVEVTGIEPVTSCLQSTRSPN